MFVEFLLVFSMRALYLAILSWLSRIDEIVDDTMILTKGVKSMDGLYRHITALVGAGVVMSKDTPVIRLHGADTIAKHPDDGLKKTNGVMIGLFIIGLKVTSP